MKTGMFGLLSVLGLFILNSQAATITAESSPNAYSVASDDLLQTRSGVDDVDYVVDTYYNVYCQDFPSLRDGSFGTPNADGGYCIANGTVTFLFNTSFYPDGYTITNVNTYTAWKDQGRIDQKYTVSFRKVGSAVFTDDVSVYYEGTNNQTFVSISDLNITEVDAVRFVFPNQQNMGVGYRELDVFGIAPERCYSVNGETTATGYTVLNDDLLQTGVESIDDELTLHYEGGYDNQGVAALSDGIYGAVDAKGSGCGISSGTLTYNLDMDASPAGYSITNVDSYAGWQDSGRDNQYYTISFQQVGSASFANGISVYYASNQGDTIDQTHVNIADLCLSGVAAIRFDFPTQENSGVGYKELDITGIASEYSDVTRLDSGSKVITNDASSCVRIVEGTGSLGDITIEAATNTIQSLSIGSTAGLSTVDPAGDILVLDSISLAADAGGLTVEPGTLMAANNRTLGFENNSTADLTINATIADGRSVASFLSKSGTGTLKLNGTNTYSGITIFGGGVVDVAEFSNYGEDGGLGNRDVRRERGREVGLLFHGGTLRYSGSTAQSTDRAIRINAEGSDEGPGGAVIDASGSNPDATLSFTAASSPDFFQGSGNRFLELTGSNTGNNSFYMSVRETGGETRVIKSGSGKWIMNGSNIYSGGTFVEGGVLQSSSVGFGAVSVESGATWDAGYAELTIAGISGSGIVTRARGQVTTGADGESLISTEKNYVHLLDFGNGSGATVNGVAFDSIGGTSGAGWSLTGCGGFYSEPISTNGYAQLVSDFRYNGNPGTLTFRDLTVGQLYNIVLYTQQGWWPGRRQDATFTNGSDIYKLQNTEPGDYGYYSFRFVAQDTSASVTMAPRTVDSFHWFAASLETEDPIPLTVGDAGDYTFAGVITGPLALIKQGSGKLTLSGTNTYSGVTTLSEGTLEITEGDSLPSSTSLEIASDASMVLNNAEVQTVNALTVDGEPLYRGTWGSAGSTADHTSSLFSGSGILNVVTGPGPPGTIIMLQ